MINYRRLCTLIQFLSSLSLSCNHLRPVRECRQINLDRRFIGNGREWNARNADLNGRGVISAISQFVSRTTAFQRMLIAPWIFLDTTYADYVTVPC